MNAPETPEHSRPEGAGGRRLLGKSKMLLVFMDEEDKHEHMPLYEAILRQLRKDNIVGGTVVRGIMGFGAEDRIYGSGTLGIGEHRPIVAIVVEEEEKIQSVLPKIQSMVKEGLVVVIDAFVHKHGTDHPSS